MFSIIAPIDTNRLEQFRKTKEIYDGFPQKKEFVMPTRSYEKVKRYFEKHNMMKDVRLIPYSFDEPGFNPSKALNIGVRNAKYENIIITSPEVRPQTDVLGQLAELEGRNVICEVSDQDEQGNLTILVSESYRGDDPSMYFLAKFNKSDIEKINGWDENFMGGYAYEDNDFGARWKRAGIPFELRMEIKAIHQYHPRSETVEGGILINERKFTKNNEDGITYCENGLK